MQNAPTSHSTVRWINRAVSTALLATLALTASVVPASAQLSTIGSSPLLVATGMRGTDSAYDPGNNVYLVVGSHGGVWGAFVNASGDVLSSFVINPEGTFGQYPRVAYSPHVSNGAGGSGGFLVTWHENATFHPFPNFVNFRIVAYPGVLVTPQRSVPGPNSWWESVSSIAYSNSSQVFFTVYRTADYRIWGARIGTNGEVASQFQVSPGGESRDPSVAWNSNTNEFGVVYTGWGGSGATTSITVVGAGGNIIRHNTFNFTGATYITDATFNPLTGRYLAAWSQGGTHGAEIAANGDVVAAGLLSSTTGAYDGLSVAYNPISGTFLLVGHGPSYDVWGAELNSRGARTSGDVSVTSAGGPLGSFYPRASARSNAAHWNVTFSHNFGAMRDQIVATTSTGGGPAGSLGSVTTPPPSPTPPPGDGGGSSSGCPGTAPFPGAVCVNGGWVPGTTDSGGSTGGCPGTAPFPGAVCVNGGWVPGTGDGGGSTSGCPGTAPFPGAVCVNGGWVPGTGGGGGSTSSCPGTAPFPGAVCVNGGWVPGTSGGSSSGCSTPDPFVAIGGGTCVNGGWTPGGSGGSSGGSTGTGSCTTPSPGSGWICVNGGWLPPDTATGSTCSTASPGSGWVCVNGGWLPPDMAPSTGGSSGGCTTPDPFTAMGGGICINGGWIPKS